MKKRMVIVVLLLILVFGGLFTFDFIRSYLIARFVKNFTLPPTAVSTVKATLETWQPKIQTIGSLQAINGVMVTTEEAGMVKQIDFHSGQFVKEGQLLVQLDDSLDLQDYNNNLAAYNLAKAEFSRQERLYKKGAQSQDAYEQALATMKKSMAQLNKAIVTLNQKSIYAAFSGKIGIRQINLGQYLQPGDTIASLQSLNPLYVNFTLPEQYLSSIFLDQKVNVNVDAYPQKIFEGKITAINSEINADSRSIELQATIENENNALYPGLFANVELLLPKKIDVITVPQTAITYSLYGDMVYVVKEVKQKNETVLKAYQCYIKLGKMQGDEVEVIDGLKPGDVVVNGGQLKLFNGITVKINNAVKLSPIDMSQLEGGVNNV